MHAMNRRTLLTALADAGALSATGASLAAAWKQMTAKGVKRIQSSDVA